MVDDDSATFLLADVACPTLRVPIDRADLTHTYLFSPFSPHRLPEW